MLATDVAPAIVLVHRRFDLPSDLSDYLHVEALALTRGKEGLPLLEVIRFIPCLLPFPGPNVVRPIEHSQVFPHEHVTAVVDKREVRSKPPRSRPAFERALVVVPQTSIVQVVRDDKLRLAPDQLASGRSMNQVFSIRCVILIAPNTADEQVRVASRRL